MIAGCTPLAQIEMLREIDVSTSYDTAIDLHRTASEIKREV